MKIKRLLRFIAGTLGMGVTVAVAAAAADDNYPSRPITIVVGFSPGSVTDILARRLADGLKERIGQPVVVDNRPGAGATMAASYVARSAPDGYTLLMTAIGHVLAPSMYKSLPYDTVEDFAGVSRIATGRVLIVANPNNVPARDINELIDLAKKNPGRFTYGSSGPGTFMHVAVEVFKNHTDVDLLHVPYRSGSEAINAVLSGHIDLTLCSVPNCTQHIADGRMKALAFIGDERSPLAPNIPSIVELGINGYDISSYNMLLAPKGTPPAVLKKLHKAVDEVVRSPQFAEAILRSGFTPTPSESPEEVDQFVRDEVIYWKKALETAGVTPS